MSWNRVWWRRRARQSPLVDCDVQGVIEAEFRLERHSQRGVWAEPALPPPADTTEPIGTTEAAPPPGVRLGFTDGTEVELDRTHPSARALRAVADLLVQDRPTSADNPSEATVSTFQAAEGS